MTRSDEDEASCLSNLPMLQSQPLGRTEEYEIENAIPTAPSEGFTCDDTFSVESAPCSTPAFSDLENDDGESVDSREDNRNEFVV